MLPQYTFNIITPSISDIKTQIKQTNKIMETYYKVSKVKFHYNFIMKFKNMEKYVTSLKGYKKRRSNQTLTVCLDLKISKRKTVIIIALLNCCLFISYLMVFLVKYVFYMPFEFASEFPQNLLVSVTKITIT